MVHGRRVQGGGEEDDFGARIGRSERIIRVRANLENRRCERDRRRNLSLMIIPTVLQKFLERCSLRASVSYGLTRKKEEDLFRSCKEFRYRHRFISSASYTTPPIKHVSRSSVFLPSISFVPTIQRSTCRRYDYFLHLFHLSDIPPCAQPPSSSLVIVIGSNL